MNGEEIQITATKEEWIEVIEKIMWVPESALREGDTFSALVHHAIAQGVYE